MITVTFVWFNANRTRVDADIVAHRYVATVEDAETLARDAFIGQHDGRSFGTGNDGVLRRLCSADRIEWERT